MAGLAVGGGGVALASLAVVRGGVALAPLAVSAATTEEFVLLLP